MITVLDNTFTIHAGASVYTLKLVDGKLCHGCYLPGLYTWEIEKSLYEKPPQYRPEAEIAVDFEGSSVHHGARFLGGGPSQRAVYCGHRIEPGDKGSETLVIDTLDEYTGLQISHCYTVYNDTDVLKRTVRLLNTGSKPISIQHLSSFMLYGIPVFSGHVPVDALRIHSFPSSWCWEGQHRVITAEEAGLYSHSCLASWQINSTGSWSCKDYAPFFVLEETTRHIFWCVQIEHSGSWRFEVDAPNDAEQGVMVQGGLGNFTFAHWSKTLMPGENFSSVPVSLACVHGSFDDALNVMHNYRACHLIQHSQADRTYPVIFNEWLTTLGACREDTVRRHMQDLEGSGIEVYTIDAGWFLPYSEGEPNDWFTLAGDWGVFESRFPNGLEKAVELIQEKGMIPGIWIEIDIVGEASQAYNNPDIQELLMRNVDGGFVKDHKRRFLYYGCETTREYVRSIFERLIAVGFRYFKIDYNVDAGPGCTNTGDSLGQGLLESVRGYYSLMDGLRADHPDIIIENCSSGGNRLDYGLMSRADLSSITDQSRWSTLAAIFFGVSRYVHSSQMGNWSRLDPELKIHETSFVLISSMLGRMHLSGDITKISDEQRKNFLEAISFYKRYRGILDNPKLFYHTENPSLQSPEGWAVMQMNAADRETVLIAAWRFASAKEYFAVCCKDINLNSDYEFTTFPDGITGTLSGTELAAGLDIMLPTEYSAVLYALHTI